METFSASLRTVGDVNSLAATIELSDGRLRIAAGDTEIGSWPLTEVHLEEIPAGYRMAVEGELLLLEFKDVSSFSTELAKSRKKKRLGIPRKKETSQKSAKTKDQPVAAPRDPVVVAPPTPTIEGPGRVATEVQTSPQPAKPGAGTRILDAIDGLLIRAKKRFGPYLPDWVFSRGMLGIAVALLALLVVFPGFASMVLLVVGGLGILFGAVVYSDPVLASRWLPGRATPQQALLTGLTVFLVGIVLGMIAR